MGVDSTQFFEHFDAFFDYRQDIYQVSQQTIKSNRVDLSLFQSFIKDSPFDTISGPPVMQFQYHLKKDRDNCGGSINRKIFTLRSYAHFLALLDVPEADTLPFYDLENRKLSVTGKGGKHRDLCLTDELFRVVSEWLAVRDLFYQSDLHRALFISKKGNRLAIRTMEDNFKKIVAASGLKPPFKVTCHSLRHSFASHLNDKDVDILVIQSLMGHASTRSTEPYIHPSLDKVKSAMEKIPAVIFMNRLIKSGVLRLRFQQSQVRRE